MSFDVLGHTLQLLSRKATISDLRPRVRTSQQLNCERHAEAVGIERTARETSSILGFQRPSDVLDAGIPKLVSRLELRLLRADTQLLRHLVQHRWGQAPAKGVARTLNLHPHVLC